MRKAIIIGFEYKNGKKLPGICVDIYQVYSFLKNIGWNDSEIIIFTDIQKDEQTEVLKSSLLEKIVDSRILTFIEDLKERNQYVEFKSTNHYNNFQSIFQNIDKSFIYYSGHSKNGNLILPNGALISLDFFRDFLKSKEIILIMDCCEGGIILPFVLNDKNFRLENEKAFVKPEIICITSSLNNENSLTTKTGSIFTRNLIAILNEQNISLYEISTHLRKKIKTGNISVSYPKLHFIFGWLYKYPNINITMTSDFILIND